MSRRRVGRAVDGLLLLDKREGVSSNRALQEIKQLFQAQKAGHTGSLDPIATGLLPICLGEATKMSAFLLNSDKRYQVTVHLGSSTTTGDVEGDVVSEAPVPRLDEAGVSAVLQRFTGDIEQIPPMYSALKHAGKRLYALARSGIEVPREPRPVHISHFQLVRFAPNQLELDVACSKGTYIRTLAEDLAKALGTCGHVVALRRTRVGNFMLEDAVTVERVKGTEPELRDALLLSVERVVADFPRLQLSDELAYFVRKGEAVLMPKVPVGRWVRLYNCSDRFLGVGEILDNGQVAPRRLLR